MIQCLCTPARSADPHFLDRAFVGYTQDLSALWAFFVSQSLTQSARTATERGLCFTRCCGQLLSLWPGRDGSRPAGGAGPPARERLHPAGAPGAPAATAHRRLGSAVSGGLWETSEAARGPDLDTGIVHRL